MIPAISFVYLHSKNNGKVLKSDENLPIMEQFYSLQGEGINTGKAAWFVRIGGCDVCCSFCDIKESWNPEHFPKTHYSIVVENAIAAGAKSVVLTGGEPMRCNLDVLTSALKLAGIEIFLETSGSEPFSGNFDWICVSPKRDHRVLDEWFDKVDELKVVVVDESDFARAESFVGKVNPNCSMLLQPEWSVSKKILPMIVDYIKKNPLWRLSLQSHKYISIP